MHVATGACVLYLLAQIEERGPSHTRAFAVVAPLGTTVRRLGLGQRAPLLEQNTEIERGDAVPAFVGAPERCLSFG